MTPAKENPKHRKTYGIKLSPAHAKAVARRRRIIVQYDACDPQYLLGGDLQASLPYRFDYIDEGKTRIDSIFWDIGFGNEAIWPSKVISLNASAPFVKWRSEGVDLVGTLVAETHRRGLEAFWNHRINEVDLAEKMGLEMDRLSPEKAAHQDWVLKTWWWQGFWNLAEPGLRQYKVDILRELAELYDFDGFQIDFSRHMPCLPVGRQWELREHVTEFMRMVRIMLLEVEAKRGRPILLSAKVPENLEGCRIDGFDVQTWVRLNLVDMLTLGSRAMDVDVAAFRRLAGSRNIKLYPCLDDHHSTDGYHHPPIEFFRGVFGNWWQQGADGVETFNWACARPEVRDRMGGGWPGPESHRQAYHECGDPESLKGLDKIFAVERRGGCPYSEGYFNQNLDSPLPALLAYDGRPASLRVRMCDALAAGKALPAEVTLHVTVFDAKPGDLVAAAMNGVALDAGRYDFEWKDRQIFSPHSQPVSGYAVPPVNPNQKLLRISFHVPLGICKLGENSVDLRSVTRTPHLLCPLRIEKVEIHVRYITGGRS